MTVKTGESEIRENEKGHVSANLSESMEDYIEVIGKLEQEHKAVRVKHIAEMMKVKMPSVSSALSVLKKKGFVNYEKYDYVELSQKGRKVARSLVERHEALKHFLVSILHVNEDTAEEDACGMEHHVSKETVDNILKFIDFLEGCPESENICMKNFRAFLETGERQPCH